MDLRRSLSDKGRGGDHDGHQQGRSGAKRVRQGEGQRRQHEIGHPETPAALVEENVAADHQDEKEAGQDQGVEAQKEALRLLNLINLLGRDLEVGGSAAAVDEILDLGQRLVHGVQPVQSGEQALLLQLAKELVIAHLKCVYLALFIIYVN
jgi:hypothetical protein